MDHAPPSPPRRSRRAKWATGVSLIVAGIVGLAAWAVTSPDAVAYYKTPSEIEEGTGIAGRNVRVGGRVAGGSLERNGTQVSFVITDGSREVPVRYTGEVPDTLKEGTDAIAEGRIVGNTLVAKRIQAKCSSKFVPKDKTEEHLGRS
ncbi:MAG: cytochrome c maturation protein CcmE [Actinomycetota bacterium]